jgi:hypothetical protein
MTPILTDNLIQLLGAGQMKPNLGLWDIVYANLDLIE